MAPGPGENLKAEMSAKEREVLLPLQAPRMGGSTETHPPAVLLPTHRVSDWADWASGGGGRSDQYQRWASGQQQVEVSGWWKAMIPECRMEETEELPWRQ